MTTYDTKPTGLRVGDTVRARFGKGEVIWLVVSIDPGKDGRPILMESRPQDPRKPHARRRYRWHDIEIGRFVRTNGVPIREANKR